MTQLIYYQITRMKLYFMLLHHIIICVIMISIIIQILLISHNYFYESEVEPCETYYWDCVWNCTSFAME